MELPYGFVCYASEADRCKQVFDDLTFENLDDSVTEIKRIQNLLKESRNPDDKDTPKMKIYKFIRERQIFRCQPIPLYNALMEHLDYPVRFLPFGGELRQYLTRIVGNDDSDELQGYVANVHTFAVNGGYNKKDTKKKVFLRKRVIPTLISESIRYSAVKCFKHLWLTFRNDFKNFNFDFEKYVVFLRNFEFIRILDAAGFIKDYLRIIYDCLQFKTNPDLLRFALMKAAPNFRPCVKSISNFGLGILSESCCNFPKSFTEGRQILFLLKVDEKLVDFIFDCGLIDFTPENIRFILRQKDRYGISKHVTNRLWKQLRLMTK